MTHSNNYTTQSKSHFLSESFTKASELQNTGRFNPNLSRIAQFFITF